MTIDRAGAVEQLRRGGLVAAEEEADELIAAAAGDAELDAMLARRLNGEPTAWITGHTTFLGVRVSVDPGVYVPRWKTESIAQHALAHLTPNGIAVDLCTGSGAIGAFLKVHRPDARVIGTDIDQRAVDNARRNGIEAYAGSLFDPLPAELRQRVDVIVSVPPYVPDAMLALLPRDVLAHEPVHALSGGVDGLATVEQIAAAASHWLTPGGAVVVEVGLDQVDKTAALFTNVHELISDGDGDPCGVCARPTSGVGARL